MLLAGSDDGVYRFPDVDGSADRTAEQVLDSGRVMRLRQFDAADGIFAATTTGLFHSTDGETWTDLGVPEERVYSVGALPDGRRYAGTRPARVYVGEFDGGGAAAGEGDGAPSVDWTECDGFRDLPSREEWRLPRHENLAQVRDLHRDPADSDRLVAGVEVGGVHVSDDGGETWTERRDPDDGSGLDDDIHELRVVGAGEYVAATGFGLFRTTDAGESWTRLDEGYDQRYFRSVASVNGVVYAGGALANSSTWDDADADPELFAVRDGDPAVLDFPASDETVTGLTAADGDLVAATHRGSVLVRRDGEWTTVGDLPVTEELTGRYTPLSRVEN